MDTQNFKYQTKNCWINKLWCIQVVTLSGEHIILMGNSRRYQEHESEIIFSKFK